jgi:hypothetical protein
LGRSFLVFWRMGGQILDRADAFLFPPFSYRQAYPLPISYSMIQRHNNLYLQMETLINFDMSFAGLIIRPDFKSSTRISCTPFHAPPSVRISPWYF